MHKHKLLRESQLEMFASSSSEDPSSPVPVYRNTTTPFLDSPGPLMEEAGTPKIRDRLSMPDIHTVYCIRPETYQWTVLTMQMIISVASLIEGIYVLKELPSDMTAPKYVGGILVLQSFVWGWCTFVLYLAPASASCTVPIFWTLMLYAHFGSFASGCGFGSDVSNDARIKALEMVNLVLVCLLVLLSWRNALGLTLLPILLFIILCQTTVVLFNKLRQSCCNPEEHTETKSEGYSAPLIQNEEQALDDGETIVELLIYDLWPSRLPVYIGKFLGAYHTGLSANNLSLIHI
eukprot:TRINITY_DN23211_c0_g1_i1.p1 TRINITY_DN23211_c0_g1~~TRINITY_DN23211_c0_g1_i1.p1  ORF type:complete len:291 (+),score=46.45 TRINITY_DN23211_c0_g1_i1:191-1063(+)